MQHLPLVWARLHLYEQMDILQTNVLYTDTDSIIYLTNIFKPNSLCLGNYLGQLTNELNVDEHIVEYIGLGPKNYGNKTNNNVEVCKVRGFTLNFTNSKLINLRSMKQMLFSEGRKQELYTENNQICRNKLLFKLYNVQMLKKYKCVYEKRVINTQTNFTYPYGF